MKKGLVIFFIFFIFCFNFIEAQNLVCCKDIKEVKKAIEGDWKLKGETNSLIYRFSFDKGKGFIEALEELNLPPKAIESQRENLILDEHEIVNVKLDKGLFFIEIKSLYYEVSEQIFVLNEKYFIYGKGQSEHVFIKDKS